MAQVPARQASAAQAPPIVEEPIPYQALLVPKQTILTNIKSPSYMGGKLLWHPHRSSLYLVMAVGQQSSRILEFDAVSGCQRAAVDCRFMPSAMELTPDGASLVLFAKTNAVAVYSTDTWACESSHALKSKKAEWSAVAICVAPGRPRPLVYFTVEGAPGLRMLDTGIASGAAARDAREGPAVKLKSENRAGILALAAYPGDPRTLLALTDDGCLVLARVSAAEGTWAPGYSLDLGLPAAEQQPQPHGGERASLHAVAHPLRRGCALVAVATRRAVLAVEVLDAREARVLGAVPPPPSGAPFCGAGFVHGGAALAAAAATPGGDAALRVLRLWPRAGDALAATPAAARPGTMLEALAGGGGGAQTPSSAGVGQVAFHPRSGELAALPRAGESAEPQPPSRLPTLQLLDAGDPAGCLGVPALLPLHSSLGFWTQRDGDGVVSRLRFPRYAHLVAGGRLAAHDLTHGLLTEVLAPPRASDRGQAHGLRSALRSPRRGLWVLLCDALGSADPDAQAAGAGPGARAWTAVREEEAALLAASRAQWFLPGRGAAWLGAGHDQLAVLAESGRRLLVYDAAKLAGAAPPKALFSVELADAGAVAIFPGPPARIAAAPEPRPVGAVATAGGGADAEASEAGATDSDDSDDSGASGASEAAARRAELAAWEARERRRVEPPRQVVALARDGAALFLLDVPTGKTARAAPARARVPLDPGEALVSLAWQALGGPPGTADDLAHAGAQNHGGAAAAAVAAALTTRRLLLLTERFAVAAVVSLPRAAGVPTSALWVGPALLVATAGGQVYLARWDGTALLLATLLAGPPASLLGALADRLLLAHDAGDGGAGVAPRALRTPELLVEGWTGLAGTGLLPGGTRRAAHALAALAASYDATTLGPDLLRRVAAAGHPRVAAALSTRSEVPGVGLMRGAVYSAMAGDWEPLVGALLGEWQASDSHPGPAPPGSALALQLAAAARVCQLYGRFGDARRLFQAAGAWPELLSLCVFQGDWAGLQQIARGTPKNVQGFAEQLLAVNENAFRGMAGKSPHGGRACLADWGVRLEARVEGTAEDPRTVLGEVAASRDEDQEEEDGGSGSERFAGDDTQHAWRPDGEVSQDTLDADADVDVAPAGRLPFMEATLLQTECTEESAGARTAGNDGAGAPIPPLEAGALASYAGLPGAVALRRAFGGSGASSGLAAGGASASPRPPSPSASDAAGGFEEEGSRHGGRGAGAASISRASDWGTESATSGGAGGAPTAGAGRVQDPRNGGSGQPPMAVDEDDDDDFFDSDDDEAFLAAALPGGAAAAAAVAAAAAPARAAGAAGTEPVDLLATGSRTPPSLASTHSGSKRFSFNIREGEGNVAGAAAAPSLKAAVQGLRLGPPPLAPPPPAGGSARYPAIQRSVSGASEDPFATLARAPSAASSAAGGQGAASDPFGLLALGSGVGGSQGQGTPSPVQAPSAGGSRHPSAGPGQASNLLAGWEDFEAMFGGTTAVLAPAPTPAPAPTAAPVPAAPTQQVTPPRIPHPPRQPTSARGTPHAATPALAAFRRREWEEAAKQLRVGGQLDGATLARLVAAALLAAAERAASPAAAARLARHAAAVALTGADAAAVLWSAAQFQAGAGNFGVAGDMLTRLVIADTEGPGANGIPTDEVQEFLNDCDRRGNGNATVAGGEDLTTFRSILASCASIAEVDDLVANVLQG
uniref:Uncharacterized protein n=1 Tax=Auxenochlorella protothecoides TaxID=3075 RepID=A0A1D1ZRJ4_AUXPR